MVDLTEEEHEKLKRLSNARGEPEEKCLERFGRKGLGKVPRNFSKHMESLRKADFVDAGVRDGMAYITLPNGRTFYGYTSWPNHRRAYEFVSDVIPHVLNADTFLLGLDVTHRYITEYSWPPAEMLPPRGGVVVEVGAYLGHKTVRFVDKCVGAGGRVLAIEMMPDNVEILRRNIEENGLSHVVDVVHLGVWNTPGTLPVKGKGRQRNSLVAIDKLQEDREVLCRVDTLDTILAEWGVPHVDLVFVTVNGAEIEVLQGLNHMPNRAGALFISAPYERDGRPSSEICREILEQKGCRIIPSSNRNRVLAFTK